MYPHHGDSHLPSYLERKSPAPTNRYQRVLRLFCPISERDLCVWRRLRRSHLCVCIKPGLRAGGSAAEDWTTSGMATGHVTDEFAHKCRDSRQLTAPLAAEAIKSIWIMIKRLTYERCAESYGKRQESTNYSFNHNPPPISTMARPPVGCPKVHGRGPDCHSGQG